MPVNERLGGLPGSPARCSGAVSSRPAGSTWCGCAHASAHGVAAHDAAGQAAAAAAVTAVAVRWACLFNWPWCIYPASHKTTYVMNGHRTCEMQLWFRMGRAADNHSLAGRGQQPIMGYETVHGGEKVFRQQIGRGLMWRLLQRKKWRCMTATHVGQRAIPGVQKAPCRSVLLSAIAVHRTACVKWQHGGRPTAA